MSGAQPIDSEGLPGFEELFLEGSFVLDITADRDVVLFVVNAALRPRHPLYEPPSDAAHCFRRLQIVFRSVRKATWFSRSDRVYTDAGGRKDRGCIDTFTATPEGQYVLEGDWGGITIESASPCVRLMGPVPSAWQGRRHAIDAWLAGTED